MTSDAQKSKDELKKERLAAQLRANLRKRKAQSKARVETPTGLAERPKNLTTSFDRLKKDKE